MLDVEINHKIGDFRLSARFRAEDGITALYGHSGSGKSSIINILAGLATPQQGRIVLDGQVLFDSATNTDLPPERRRLGYVFQDPRLFPHLNVKGNLVYGMNLVPKKEHHQDFDQVVSLLKLTGLLERRPAGLSGGEKQRVSIGRALLASPRLLLMDEPLASLDSAHKEEILPFIESLRDELSLPIVYVSHAMEEIVRLAETVVILSNGEIAASGPIEEVMSRIDPRHPGGRQETGAVFSAIHQAYDPDYGLSELSFAENRLLVPRLEVPLGSALRIRIRAKDVSLSLSRPKDSSVLNIFKGVITEIEAGEHPQTDVGVDVGVPLIARITRRSCDRLALAPGKRVYALVKAVAIDRKSLGGQGGSNRS
jgi:molybdate transport system ATP-binding protein